MKPFGSRAALIAGYAVLVAANAMVLGAALWNRWGGPRAQIELTERELTMPLSREKDDTGVVLTLMTTDQVPAIRMAYENYPWRRASAFDHPWLDRAKLRSLGFDVDLDPTDASAKDYYGKALPRPVFVAFELDGDAWRGWLARQEKRIEALSAEADGAALAARRLAVDREMRSRLTAVDADTDAEALQHRYPDSRRYLVVPAVINPEVVESPNAPPTLVGKISQLVVEQVLVPLALVPRLEPFLPRITGRELREKTRAAATSGLPAPTPPRYRAVVAFGRRREPWLVSVTPIEGSAN
jgi:hypothetical protein